MPASQKKAVNGFDGWQSSGGRYQREKSLWQEKSRRWGSTNKKQTKTYRPESRRHDGQKCVTPRRFGRAGEKPNRLTGTRTDQLGGWSYQEILGGAGFRWGKGTGGGVRQGKVVKKKETRRQGIETIRGRGNKKKAETDRNPSQPNKKKGENGGAGIGGNPRRGKSRKTEMTRHRRSRPRLTFPKKMLCTRGGGKKKG